MEAAPWSGFLHKGPQNLLITGSPLFLNHKDGHKSPKECEPAGWDAPELQTGLGRVSFAGWWRRAAAHGETPRPGVPELHVAFSQDREGACVTEMQTKSNSCGLKSKIGCLWESNMMWFLISFSLM